MHTSNILKNVIYNDDKPAILVLFETATTKEIRIVFKSGQLMKKHQTSYPISVEMVEGTLNFGVDNKMHHLERGDLLALEGNIPHDLKATSDCVVRLTLSKQDTVQRVKKVLRL